MMTEKEMKIIKEYPRLVYWGFSRDWKIMDLTLKCYKEKKMLIVIVPTSKRYDKPLMMSLGRLGVQCQPYEVSMGMKNNLRHKAYLYKDYYDRQKSRHI